MFNKQKYLQHRVETENKGNSGIKTCLGYNVTNSLTAYNYICMIMMAVNKEY